jgi:hypothetical protein
VLDVFWQSLFFFCSSMGVYLVGRFDGFFLVVVDACEVVVLVLEVVLDV